MAGGAPKQVSASSLSRASHSPSHLVAAALCTHSEILGNAQAVQTSRYQSECSSSPSSVSGVPALRTFDLDLLLLHEETSRVPPTQPCLRLLARTRRTLAS